MGHDAFKSTKGNTAININTADPIVIAALIPELSKSTAENIIEDREDDPFETINDFVFNASIENIGSYVQGLSTQSSYFNLESEVKIGNSIIKNNSLLYRLNSQNVSVISRTPKQ